MREDIVSSQTLKCIIEMEPLHVQGNQVLIGRNGNWQDNYYLSCLPSIHLVFNNYIVQDINDYIKASLEG